MAWARQSELYTVCGGLQEGRFFFSREEVGGRESLTSESVECASLSFQGVDDVHGGDCLPLGMLSVGDGIADDVLQEYLEDTACLLVDEARDTLDTATTSETAYGRFGDALDVVTQHLAMSLRASLS